MFEHLPYNPNISMVSAASVSSKDQAAVIDRICCVVGGHGVFSTGGFVKIGEISPSVFFEDAFSFHKAESASAFEEDNPEGTWAVLVYFRPIVSDEMKNRVEGMFLSGLIPDAVRKVACFQIQGRSFNWIGGQRALSRAGIPILEDTSEVFTIYRWDPIMELRGRPTIHMPELGVEVPENIAASLGDDVLSQMALIAAVKIMGKHAHRNMMAADLAKIVDTLSLGKLSFELKEEVSLTRGRRSALVQGYLPPKGHPSRAALDCVYRCTGMLRIWEAYLKGYGVQLAERPEKDVLEELATDELHSILSEVASGGFDVRDPLELARLVVRAAELVQREDDMALTSTQMPTDTALEWHRDGFRGSRFSHSLIHPGNASPTASSRAVDVLVATLNSMIMEVSGDPADGVKIECVMFDELQIAKTDYLSRMTDYAPRDRWAVVSVNVPATTMLDIGAGGLCAIAAGWTEGLDLDGLAVLVGNFDGLDHDRVLEAFDVLTASGVAHIADWGNDLACANLEDVAEITDDNAQMKGLVHGNYHMQMLSPDVVASKILEELDEAGRAQALAQAQVSFVLVIRYTSPELACAMVRVLSSGTIDMKPDAIAMPATEDNSLYSELLQVLRPAADFFGCEEVDEIEKARDLVLLWSAVLHERGLVLSKGFPIGVSQELFDKLRQVIGIDSFTHALSVGIPLDDIVDVEWEEMLL